MDIKSKYLATVVLIGAVSAVSIGPSAAAQTPGTTSLFNPVTQGHSKLNIFAAESGGSDSSGSGSVTDILAQIAAAARAAGGWAILGKSCQVIYYTARSCPQCFLV